MSMVTTCPNCATSFSVAPEVLLSRNGRVRCGQCKQIFDGLLSVTTLEEFQSASGVAAGGAAEATASPPAAPAEIIWPALPDVPEVPIPPMPLEIAAAASPAYLPQAALENDEMPPVEPVSSPAPARLAFHSGDADVIHEADELDPAPPPRARWLWPIAATLAALVFAGQVLYRYRSELAANVPVTKPALTRLCAWAGCSVPSLQQPAALNIEASDLQVVDQSKPHLVQLTATLRNRAAIDVGYPALDLVLTDNRDHALARRVFVPADYLPPNAAQSAIAANAESTVRIDMDISGLPAAGFRLNLTPAPTN